MVINVYLKGTSSPIVHSGVGSTYVDDLFYCINSNGDVCRYLLSDISYVEEDSYTGRKMT